MTSVPVFDFSISSLPWKTTLVICLTPVAWRIIRRILSKADSRTLSNIPGPVPASYLTGHIPALFSRDSWDFHRDLAKEFGRTSRIRGFMGENFLFTYDTKAMYHILTKDQRLYDESFMFIANNHITFGPGLMATVGDQHRKQRKMLNPVFSVPHLRHMVPIFFAVTEQLRDTIHKKVSNGSEEIEMMTWMTRAALEIVGRSALGTSFGPVTDEQSEHPFIAAVKGLGPLMSELLIAQILVVPLAYKLHRSTTRLQRFIVDIVPWGAVKKMKDIVDTIHHTSLEIFETKRKTLTQDKRLEISQSQDIISILMGENGKALEEDKLTDAEVVAQMSVLMFAAMDTTSSALARILNVLSTHQDAQDRLRAELREARENFGSQPGHDQLVGLPYLEAVCKETLRLYPPVGHVFRESQADALLPLSTPIKGIDGEEISEIMIPPNQKILLSIEACNRDPEIWGSDSFEWKPERWLNPLPQAVSDAHIPGIYSHLMTFLGGARSCIGFKFSELEMKVILFVLINDFKFLPPKQEIFWQTTIIATPTTDPLLSQPRPDMPLKVILAD